MDSILEKLFDSLNDENVSSNIFEILETEILKLAYEKITAMPEVYMDSFEVLEAADCLIIESRKTAFMAGFFSAFNLFSELKFFSPKK